MKRDKKIVKWLEDRIMDARNDVQDAEAELDEYETALSEYEEKGIIPEDVSDDYKFATIGSLLRRNKRK